MGLGLVPGTGSRGAGCRLAARPLPGGRALRGGCGAPAACSHPPAPGREGGGAALAAGAAADPSVSLSVSEVMSPVDLHAEREKIRREIEELEKSLDPAIPSIEVLVSDSSLDSDSDVGPFSRREAVSLISYSYSTSARKMCPAASRG